MKLKNPIKGPIPILYFLNPIVTLLIFWDVFLFWWLVYRLWVDGMASIPMYWAVADSGKSMRLRSHKLWQMIQGDIPYLHITRVTTHICILLYTGWHPISAYYYIQGDIPYLHIILYTGWHPISAYYYIQGGIPYLHIATYRLTSHMKLK